MSRYCMALVLISLLPLRSHAADVSIHFEPREPMMDEPVQIRITGLTPGVECTVRARAIFGGKTWQSTATFQADPQGNVDVSTQAPTKGTYSGAVPMGLFWSMEQQPDESKPAPLKITDPRVTTFEVESGGKIVARAELKRWMVRPGVRMTPVKEAGMFGTLFEPAGEGRRPGLLVLSGSDGGVSEGEAALLASHGYVTFAQAYFRAPGLPDQLVKIPLEHLKLGLDWLAARPSVDGKRLGISGGSKGAELALLLASHYPEVKVVIARAPSHVAWSGIGGTYRDASWTFQGQPVPYHLTNPLLIPRVMSKRPLRFIELYGPSLDNEAGVAKALIPVEKIQGAVLLISGEDDAMWPAAKMGDAIVARMRQHQHKYPVEHLKYPGAGHAIPSTFVPTKLTIESAGLAMGGTPEANAKAQADARPRVLRFLKDNLKSGE